jgi:hypothetical protein
MGVFRAQAGDHVGDGLGMGVGVGDGDAVNVLREGWQPSRVRQAQNNAR